MTLTTEKILTVDGLGVRYGRATALTNVSMSVSAGSAVALLGANGAGKTTTIRAISGLLGVHDARITAGSITFRGEDITAEPSHKIAALRIAHVPEGRLVFADLTVEENLKLGETARRTPNADGTRERMLELFPVLRKRFRDAGGYLSGGEQQMLAIARALMADPDLLLVDEVSLGLAPIVTHGIFEALETIRRDLGTTMLVVEQNAKLALSFCDEAFIIENGEVTLSGPSAALKSDLRVQDLYLGSSTTRIQRKTAKREAGKR